MWKTVFMSPNRVEEWFLLTFLVYVCLFSYALSLKRSMKTFNKVNNKLFKVARMSALLWLQELNGCISSWEIVKLQVLLNRIKNLTKLLVLDGAQLTGLVLFSPSLFLQFVAYLKICLCFYDVIFTVNSECFTEVCQSLFILPNLQSYLLNSYIFFFCSLAVL